MTTISMWCSQSMNCRLRKKSMWYTCTEKTRAVGQWLEVFVVSAVIGSLTRNQQSGRHSTEIHMFAIVCSPNQRALVLRT